MGGYTSADVVTTDNSYLIEATAIYTLFGDLPSAAGGSMERGKVLREPIAGNCVSYYVSKNQHL